MYYTNQDEMNAVQQYADAYLRYSDKNQDELSIEYQMEETQAYADKNGITIRKWYIDRAKSAKKVAGRDEFYQYIETVKNDTAAPILLVWRTNRAFRNSYESHIYRKLLRENAIKLISATQNIDEDTSSGRLVTNILADIDQYKSEEIGDHVTAASRSLVKRNPRAYLGQQPIFGYKVIQWKDGDATRQEYAINESESPVVAQLFQKFIDGQSLYNLAAWMNEQGYTTRRGQAWSYQSIRDLIKNDFYKGTRSYMKKSGDPIIIENGVPAIIPADVWERAQRQFRAANAGAGKPRRQRNGRVYALSGKIKCGLCGANIVGKGGKQYQYYVCGNMEKARLCTCKRIRKEVLEQYALDQVRLHILNDTMIDKITAQAVKAFNALPSPIKNAKELKAQKEKLLREIANIVQMKLDGDISADVFAMMKAEKEAAAAQIDKELILAENAPEIPTNEQIAAKIKKLIKTAHAARIENGELIKTIFDNFIHEIVIDNESVVVSLSISLDIFSHKQLNRSPILALCEKAPYERITPRRVPFAEWKRKTDAQASAFQNRRTNETV